MFILSQATDCHEIWYEHYAAGALQYVLMSCNLQEHGKRANSWSGSGDANFYNFISSSHCTAGANPTLDCSAVP